MASLLPLPSGGPTLAVLVGTAHASELQLAAGQVYSGGSSSREAIGTAWPCVLGVGHYPSSFHTTTTIRGPALAVLVGATYAFKLQLAAGRADGREAIGIAGPNVPGMGR